MADDFTLQLGLDTSPAEKAIKKIERMLARVGGAGALGGAGGGSSGGGSENRRARAMQQVDTIQRKINRSFGEGSEQAARFSNQIARIRDNIGAAANQKGFIKVAGDMRILREEVTATNASLKRQQRIISRGQQINEGFNTSLKNMARSYLSVFAVIEAGRGFFTMTRDLDSVQASMLAASGSAELAAKDFGFVQQVSKDLNVDLLTAAKGFQKIGAAMREGFTKDQIKEVFTSAAEASIAFGLSVDDTEGVMRAFSQIASKGTVNTIAA